jgi:hypothetical protein
LKKGSPRIVAAHLKAAPAAHLLASRQSRPVFPRLVADQPSEAGKPSNASRQRVCGSVSQAQYEWDERWDGLS